MTLREVTRRDSIHSLPHPIDAGPPRLVFRERAQAKLLRELAYDLAPGMGPDFVVRQIVSASPHFPSKISRKRLQERGVVRPTEGGQEFRQSIGAIEGRE